MKIQIYLGNNKVQKNVLLCNQCQDTLRGKVFITLDLDQFELRKLPLKTTLAEDEDDQAKMISDLMVGANIADDADSYEDDTESIIDFCNVDCLTAWFGSIIGKSMAKQLRK